MKYLLIEDSSEKSLAITSAIKKHDVNANITFAEDLSEARSLILTKLYDLIVFDIFLPIKKGLAEQDVSAELIEEFARSKNYYCETIAITAYVDELLARSSLFNSNGIIAVAYSLDDNRWEQSLATKIKKASANSRLDFLIFCALPKERAAYKETEANLGELRNIGGLNCQEISISGYQGMCVVPARMGLVSMAIAATKAIELFKPKIVGMSGICAGVAGESNLLDIVIGELCWEYQTGKYKDGTFKQEPYQAPVCGGLNVELGQLTERADILASIKVGLFEYELKTSKIIFGPVSSGSAVIADEEKMKEIGLQHRKWSALEMEMYALYEAAHHSVIKPLWFAAKCVVDLGNSSKGDSLHETACTLSARLVINVMKKQLPTLT